MSTDTSLPTGQSLAPQGVDIHFLRSELDRIEDELIAKIPEYLFVQHILPIIACEPGHTSLEPWVHLAGSTLNRIAVYGADRQVLFVLPPMAVSPRVDQDRESRSSLYEAMEHYKLLSGVQPRAAQKYLDDKLASVIRSDSRDYAALEQIDSILERYGKPRRFPKEVYAALRGEPAAAPSTASTTQDTPDVSDIGDDL